MEFLVGRGKSDITPFIPGIVMLGYGNPKNTVISVDTPISVRTFWIKSQSSLKQFLFINLEICFITQALVDDVWQRIENEFADHKLNRSQIIFSAQHMGTHIIQSIILPQKGFHPQSLIH